MSEISAEHTSKSSSDVRANTFGADSTNTRVVSNMPEVKNVDGEGDATVRRSQDIESWTTPAIENDIKNTVASSLTSSSSCPPSIFSGSSLSYSASSSSATSRRGRVTEHQHQTEILPTQARNTVEEREQPLASSDHRHTRSSADLVGQSVTDMENSRPSPSVRRSSNKPIITSTSRFVEYVDFGEEEDGEDPSYKVDSDWSKWTVEYCKASRLPSLPALPAQSVLDRTPARPGSPPIPPRSPLRKSPKSSTDVNQTMLDEQESTPASIQTGLFLTTESTPLRRPNLVASLTHPGPSRLESDSAPTSAANEQSLSSSSRPEHARKDSAAGPVPPSPSLPLSPTHSLPNDAPRGHGSGPFSFINLNRSRATVNLPSRRTNVGPDGTSYPPSPSHQFASFFTRELEGPESAEEYERRQRAMAMAMAKPRPMSMLSNRSSATMNRPQNSTGAPHPRATSNRLSKRASEMAKREEETRIQREWEERRRIKRNAPRGVMGVLFASADR